MCLDARRVVQTEEVLRHDPNDGYPEGSIPAGMRLVAIVPEEGGLLLKATEILNAREWAVKLQNFGQFRALFLVAMNAPVGRMTVITQSELEQVLGQRQQPPRGKVAA
jgi:hypothetical protein